MRQFYTKGASALTVAMKSSIPCGFFRYAAAPALFHFLLHSLAAETRLNQHW